MTEPRKTRSYALIGAAALLIGLWPIMIAFDIVHAPPDSIHAPRWVLAAAGGVFLLGGCMVFLQAHERLLDLLASALLSIFCALGVWASLFAPAESFSGGLFFLPHEMNVKIGRGVSGFGAMLTFACALYAFRLAARGRR